MLPLPSAELTTVAATRLGLILQLPRYFTCLLRQWFYRVSPTVIMGGFLLHLKSQGGAAREKVKTCISVKHFHNLGRGGSTQQLPGQEGEGLSARALFLQTPCDVSVINACPERRIKFQWLLLSGEQEWFPQRLCR